MNIIEKFEALADDHRWEEALSVAKEIIERAPTIDTSWFNYGVCLDELGRHGEAAEAFIKAQELNRLDTGIHYRIFRSFYLAKDYTQFLEFAAYACDLNKQTLELLLEDKDFRKLFELDEFKEFKRRRLGSLHRLRVLLFVSFVFLCCSTLGILIVAQLDGFTPLGGTAALLLSLFISWRIARAIKQWLS